MVFGVCLLSEHVNVSGVELVARFAHRSEPNVILKFLLLLLEALGFEMRGFLVSIKGVQFFVAIVRHEHVKV